MRLAFWRRRPIPSALEQRDAWLEWLENGGYREKTVDDYRRVTTRFLDQWPELRFDQFNDEHIIGFIEQSKPASRVSMRAPFHNWFGWAVRTKRIERNPMIHVPAYKQPKHTRLELRRRGLALDSVGFLLRHADYKTTRQIYIHTDRFDIRRELEALGEQ